MQIGGLKTAIPDGNPDAARNRVEQAVGNRLAAQRGRENKLLFPKNGALQPPVPFLPYSGIDLGDRSIRKFPDKRSGHFIRVVPVTTRGPN